MQKPPPDPDVADTAPVSAQLTGYDEQHIITYLRLLDASAEGADWKEVLARWHPDVIVAADNWDLLPDLEAEGSGWTSVYKDDDGEVFVRS